MSAEENINNTILVTRDYPKDREEFIDSIDNDKIKSHISKINDIPCYYKQMFPRLDGWGVKREIKKRVDMLNKSEELLSKMLLPNEEVRFITKGTYHKFAERYFLGLMAYYMNQTVFIFTNFRIILFNSDTKQRPRHMKWHIPYDQVKKFKSVGLFSSTCTLILNDKTKMTFLNVPMADRKILKVFLPEMIKQCHREDFHMPSFQSKDNLCTACFEPVPKKTYACDKCDEKFVNPMKPALMSLMLPCLGDMYLGHWGFAILELFSYALLWVIIIGGFAENGMDFLPAAFVMLAMAHVFDFAITRHMAMKGLIPESKTWGRK